MPPEVGKEGGERGGGEILGKKKKRGGGLAGVNLVVSRLSIPWTVAGVKKQRKKEKRGKESLKEGKGNRVAEEKNCSHLLPSFAASNLQSGKRRKKKRGGKKRKGKGKRCSKLYTVKTNASLLCVSRIFRRKRKKKAEKGKTQKAYTPLFH